MKRSDKILVVDDDDSARYLLQLLFSPDDASAEGQTTVIQAENGKIALEMLELHPDTDVILLDLYMPEMNGFEFLRRIRASSELGQIPVCVLTGGRDDVVDALRFGANDFVSKPYNAEELKLRVANLIKVRRKTAEIEQCKLNFLSTISHELRTPMNGIIGMTELLVSSGLTPQQTEFIETIGESADYLLSLINDILAFIGNAPPQLEVTSMPFRLSLIIRELVDTFDQTARKKRIRLAVEAAPGTPDHLLGAPYNLRQVLQHLVSNAIKFTESGEVRISFRSETTPQQKVRLFCSVEDTGIGIPSDQQLKIFEPFVQCDNSATRRFGGIGIGLSVAYCQVQRMGGMLSVTSTPGVGSCFSFDILCLPDAAFEAAPHEHPGTPMTAPHALHASASVPQPDGSQGLRILLVEDLLMNQRVVSHLLKLLGHRVTIAANGVEAVSAWKENRFDIVFMDLHMPIMDGLEATRQIRALEGAAEHSVPIVAMTADVMNGTEDRCLQAGMNGYLAKPVTLATLSEQIKLYI